MDTKTDVFISYARGDKTTEDGKKRQLVVDKIVDALKTKGYNIFIDIEKIMFRGSIEGFIRNLGKAKYIIIILSDKYLKSKWCMMEVAMMLEYPDFRKRIFPIVIEDTKIYDATGRADYIIYWQEQINDLQKAIEKITDRGASIPIARELNIYKKIHSLIADFSDTMGFMNLLKAEDHIDTNFDELINAIEREKTGDPDLFDKLTSDYEELKQKYGILEKKNTESKKEKEKQIKALEAQVDSLRKKSEELVEHINKTESRDKELITIINDYKENEKRVLLNKEEELQKLKKQEEEASLPYNVLKINNNATSDEIEKQYSKLKKEYKEGINNATASMRLTYENELENLENAYKEIYLTVKEKEDKNINEAYAFLNLNQGATSNEIKETYDKILKELNTALNSNNQNIVKAAKEDLDKLEAQFQYLYLKVRDKEVEEEKNFHEITPANMVYVHGGKFKMGIKNSNGDYLDHEVEVKSFFIDKYPLLVKEYRDFCGDFNMLMPEPPPWGWKDDHPMVKISWLEAFYYSKCVGKRLPTEAEWEFAARGGIRTKKFNFAGGNNIDQVAWYLGNSNKTTNPVGWKKPNELGIFDMCGNVWEWCNDWYDENYFEGSGPIDSSGPADGTAKVLRGGSFKVDKNYCTLSKRLFNFPNHYNESWGVRFVKDYTE
jgi:formylglycine-generating enzyme required for sulfatase activity